MSKSTDSLVAKLDEKEKEIHFYKKELERITKKNLLELEEHSQHASLLKEKISIIDSHQQQLATILDSIPADVYICDIDTYEVLFMNAFMEKSFTKDCVGKACWKVFRNYESPCSHCTNDELKKNIGEIDQIITWEAKNPLNKKWYLNHDVAIPWVNGKRVRMQIAIDISTRIEIEQELKESQAQYHALSRMLRLMCDNVPDMIWAKNLDKRYVFANKALCENLLNAVNAEEPIGENDLFFAKRERNSRRENPDWHTFGEVCRDSDAITMDSGTLQHFEEYGNVKGKFLFLDVHKAPFLNEKGEMIGTVGCARDVTAAKETEAKLKEKETRYRKKIENRYRTIINTTQEGVCSLDENFSILFANRKMADILGYDVEELQGKNISNFISPSNQEEHFHHLRNNTAGLNESYDQKFLHKNGHDCWVRISTTAIEDEQGNLSGSFLMFSDITDVKNASKQLLQNFERLKMAQAVGKIGSWEYDIQTEELWISEEGYKICGVTPESVNEPLKDNLLFFLPQIISDACKETEPAKKKKNNEVEFTIVPEAQTESLYIKSVAECITKDRGKPEKIVGVIQDISTLKKAEIALKETHAQLLHAAKLSAVGKLSSSIAHEFNNPLQGVLNILSGVQERASLSADDTELMNMAIVECKRMKELIISLQDFNKPTHSKLDLVNLQTMIDSLLLLNKKELSHRGVTVKTEYQNNIPYVRVIGDQIKQVILNLLKNAIHACQNGDTITIRLDGSSPDNIIIHISDTGCGINPEDLDQIFDPFFTTKPNLKGTGLGLSVSYGIIKKHHGRIDVTSSLGEGSTFSVTLPIKG